MSELITTVTAIRNNERINIVVVRDGKQVLNASCDIDDDGKQDNAMWLAQGAAISIVHGLKTFALMKEGGS